MAAEDRGRMSGDVWVERERLAWEGARERCLVARSNGERADVVALFQLAGDEKLAPAVPREAALGFLPTDVAHYFERGLEQPERHIGLAILTGAPAEICRGHTTKLKEAAAH